MAGQRLDIMDIRQLIKLKEKGMSNRKVALALGISRNTVNTYVNTFSDLELNFQQLEKLTETELVAIFPQADYKDPVRYEKLSALFPYIEEELSKPGATLQNLWKDYHENNPLAYAYTQFVHYYQLWAKPIKASGILDHKAGEKLYVDFAGKHLSYVDRDTGELIKAEVFVAILPCSQYTYVQAVKSQKREDFIDCLNSALQWYEGAPKAIVSDNLKSAVSKGHKYAPEINKTLKDFALHYDCFVDPARPYHPQDKALVEGAVKLVYQRIYYPLSKQTFFSITELNQAIKPLLVAYNDYMFQRLKTTRKQRYLDNEKAFLLPLPAHAYEIRQYRKAKVQKISHIYMSEDRNYYSVPYKYIGMSVEIQYDSNSVEIFFNKDRVAVHKRCYKSGVYTTQKEHMPSTHQAYNDWSPDSFYKRAEKVGTETTLYIRRLIEQYAYPEAGYKQAQGILFLTKSYSTERLENACKRAMSHQKSTFHTIERILKNGLDQAEDILMTAGNNQIPDHENTRGAENYS
jgi:transposase